MISCIKYLILFVVLRCGCGNAGRVRRLVGEPAAPIITRKDGTITMPTTTAYPYLAQVQYREDVDSYFEYKCGGAIITLDIVLTVAHCIHKLKIQNFRIEVGTFERIHTTRSPIQVRNILKMERHPKYIDGGYDNDIAVVWLTQKLKSSNVVQPIRMAVDDYVGESGFVIGWGRQQGGKLVNYLQRADLEVISNSECKKSLKRFLNVTPSMVCGIHSKRKQTTCRGDSGGPFVVNQKETGYVLVGLTSAGICLQKKTKFNGNNNEIFYNPERPAIFTRIFKHRPWIIELMEKHQIKKN